MSSNILSEPLRAEIRELFDEWKRLEDEKPEVQRYEPPMTARQLGVLLGSKGREPGKMVYEMVKDGRIPESCIIRKSTIIDPKTKIEKTTRMLFHTDRIRQIMDDGGFVRRDDEQMRKAS